jgi:hypothetical protein
MGEKYNHARNIIKYYEYTGQIEVVGITAKHLPDFSILDGYPIIECNKLEDIDYDYIMVMSDKFYNEITAEVISEYNVPINKFIKCSILFIPNLDFKDYIALKESNISIVSNNCWGLLYTIL